MTDKWVFLFHEAGGLGSEGGSDPNEAKNLFGGKGANLAEMARIGLPVPPGFIISTEACNTYLQHGAQFPDGMWEQALEALKSVEEQTGKGFGDPSNPLLLSCRSGARFSMPGMMDTVLNIGLNDETASGLIKITADERFVYDLYRRLIHMFGNVVMGIADEIFEEALEETRARFGIHSDAEMTADGWRQVTETFKSIFRQDTHREFPMDPNEQLKMATEAVFESWNGKRAVDYRNAAGIPHDLGTAVNIVTMVFGNMGEDSATGVAMTRNSSTGKNLIEGDYLTNAQGEDVVAGIRQTKDISLLAEEMPDVWKEFAKIAHDLETHYRDMQDVEFTIERGKLWMLQTRDGKRSAQSAVRIAAEMADEGLITREEAVLRITPEQVDFFLHPQFEVASKKNAKKEGDLLGEGLNVSPGAAVGVIALDADLAENWSKDEGKKVIMVRPETKPDDVHGMLAAEGILTSRGGRTSHAALVARQFGKPAVVGMGELNIDMRKRLVTIHDRVIQEGEFISIDGTMGEVYAGELATTIPDIRDQWLLKILSWADEHRRLGVWANADYPEDAKRAREYGAEGIGLCRTEHMFFESERLPIIRQMIMADLPSDRRNALDKLLPYQREDFDGLFRAMDGLPVIIRLIDPPLHEFLPSHLELVHELADLKIRLQHAEGLEKIDELLQEYAQKARILNRIENIREENPMLGLRGVRLGIHIPELTLMQVRAIFEAACQVTQEGLTVKPEVMIPLTCHVNELKVQQAALEKEARNVMAERKTVIRYKFGTMIEIPRAALTCDEIAAFAAFISFGTNDLTQTTFGISRDDAEAGFLIEYMENGILPQNPFSTIDINGVGQLMAIAIQKGRSRNPDLEAGICGEHGGDPDSIDFCHRLGLNYVSCSPFRIPVARLAAAHAALKEKRETGKTK
jgi:pyruvate,orthophosphate dikinase